MKNLHTTPAVALCGLRGRSRTLKVVVAVGLISWIIIALVFWRIRRSKPSPAAVQQKQLTFSTDFQVVEEGSGFVYSAYIDDRPARDVSSKADSVVRIFVYFLRTIDVKRKWKCLLWLEGNDAATPAPIATVTDLNTLTKFRFMVAMVICDMPASQSHLVVKGVSLRSSDSRHNETTNFVDVIDLRRSTSRPLTAEPTVATFTVCTSPIHGNYYNVSDIVNFIEVSRTLGAERFVFYFDRNLDPSIRSCLESYRDGDDGIVEMYAFSPPVLDGLHYHGQILSITECVYRTMYRTMYLLNQDIDEVLVPTKADDWPTMLDSIHRRIGRPAADRIASYSFQNQFFPLEAKDDPTFSDSFLVRRYDIKVLLKTEKESYVYPHGHRSKVMARPDRILIWHVHLILQENVIDRNDTIHLVSTKDALLHHYRSLPAKRGALLRDQRMLRNASLITDRVHSGRGRCLAIDSNAQT